MTKSEKIQEVLKVLDLSEEGQYIWFEENFELEEYSSRLGFVPVESMCDAAFQMRDELIHEDSDSWADGCWYVTCWGMIKNTKEPRVNVRAKIAAEYIVLGQSPIYWLVAIHIARLLKEDTE